MKIRKSSRITALFLALVMILPLISIPTFAEEVTATPTPIWTNDVEDATKITDVFSSSSNKATIDSTTFATDAKHNKVIAWDNTPDASWLDNGFAYSVNEGNGNDKWGAITAIEVDGEKGTGTFTYSGATYYFDACTINKDAVNTTKMEAVYTDEAKTTAVTDKSFYLCTSQVRVAKQGDKANIAKPSRIIPNIKGQLFTLSADYYFASDLDMQAMDIRLQNPSVHFFAISGTNPGAGTVTVQRHGDLNKAQNTINVAHAIAIAKDAWHTFTVVVDSTAATAGTQITAYVDGQLCFDIFMAGNEMTSIDWNVGHTTRGGKVSDNEGHWYADNFAIYEGNVVPESWNETEIYAEDFENLSVNDGYVADGTQLVEITANTATVGEDNGNKYLKVAFGASTQDKNYMLKAPKLSYNNYTWVKFEAKYNNQATAATTGSTDSNQGMMWSQYRFYSATGESNKGYVNLYRINVKNGQLISADGKTSFNNAIKQGWNTVTVYINLKTGEQNLYANGALVVKGGSIGKTNLDLFKSDEGYGRWTALKLDNGKVKYTEGTDYGYFGLDDASISYLYDLDETGAVYEAAFENDTVGQAPKAYLSGLTTVGTVKQETSGNKYWEIPVAGNVNKNAYIQNPGIYNDSTIVIEADHMIPADGAGMVDIRFGSNYCTFVKSDGTVITNRNIAWMALYRLSYTANSNTVTVTPGGNQDTLGATVANTFAKGAWVKITAVIDAVNGIYNLYINNRLAVANIGMIPQYSDGGWQVGVGVKNFKIVGGQLIITSPNSACNSYAAGTIGVDNIKIYTSTDSLNLVDGAAAPFAGFSEDFSTATPKVLNKNSSYKDAEVPSTVVNGAYSIPTADSATTNVNVIAKNAEFNYLNAPKVVLEAKYTVPEGGIMKVQSQFYQAAITTSAGEHTIRKNQYWIDLYTITATDAATAPTVTFHQKGQVDKVYKTEVTRGKQFTVNMIINLKNGDAELYVDGVLYAEGHLLPNGLADIRVHANEWIIAKPNTVPDGVTYAGNLLVDDASISVLDSSKIVDESGKGLVSAKVNGKLVKDSAKFYGTVTEKTYFNSDNKYDNSIISTYNKASIRLSTTAGAAESGLRFISQVDTEALAELFALVGDKVKSVTYGTLIAPTDYLTEGVELTMESLGAGKYLAVEATEGLYYNGDTTGLELIDGYDFVAGSIVEIKNGNLDRDFSGRGYVKVELYNGETIVFYSETSHSVDVQAQATATKAIEGYYDSLSEELKAVLDAYIAGPVVEENTEETPAT